MSMVLFHRLDGAYSQIGEGYPAFGGGRSPRYATFLIGTAPDPALIAADTPWVRGLWDAPQPHAIGTGEGYANDLEECGEDRVRATYGVKYERLAAHQRPVRPEQRLPPQREHQAGLIWRTSGTAGYPGWRHNAGFRAHRVRSPWSARWRSQRSHRW